MYHHCLPSIKLELLSVKFSAHLGRNDMARQFEIMQSSSPPTSRRCKNPAHILCPSHFGSRQTDWIENSYSQGSNPAERWASLVRPLLSTPSTDNAPSGPYVGMMVSRHFLLTTLENSPSCQVAFEVRPFIFFRTEINHQSNCCLHLPF